MTTTHIVVGAGQAGGWAAISMRRAGFTGRILLIGDEPWRPYERPPLSKAMLAADPEPPVLFFHDERLYAELNIELMLGAQVEEIDPSAHQVRLRDGGLLAYDRLLLATGGRARPLTVPGGRLVHLLRTLEEFPGDPFAPGIGQAYRLHRRRRDWAGDRLVGPHARLRGYGAGGHILGDGPVRFAGGGAFR